MSGNGMTLEEIKKAVDSGKKVYWKNDGYIVEKWPSGYEIVCQQNEHAVGLTWADGVTMSESEEDFYVIEE